MDFHNPIVSDRSGRSMTQCARSVGQVNLTIREFVLGQSLLLYRFGYHCYIEMPEQKFEESLNTENVVASTDMGLELDLQTVAMDLAGADYDPDNFPGLVYRMDDPKCASLIFRSGKVVCTGATSVEDVNRGISAVFDAFEDIGIDIERDNDVTVQNIVTSADLGASLNLNAIAIGLGLEQVEYEPEQFPGLVYRLEDPDVVILLFGSGKMVITGGKEEADAVEAVRVISDELDNLGLLD
jgi:transcription initiation factor TFIID TATA-box-binding protein